MTDENLDKSERGVPQSEIYDDDGVHRTGTLMSATAHIITAVIGSGVLSLAWAIAQLGWIAGPLILLAFALITWYCLALLADSYKYNGKRNTTYKAAVRAYLGEKTYFLCALTQYANLVGVSIGYTITSAISMGAVVKSNCFHKHGHDADCQASTTIYVIVFACLQIVFSQLPNYHKLSWLSYIAAIMSFGYSGIGLGLSIARIAANGIATTSITGTVIGVDVSASEKVWKCLQSIGNIAFAYNYSMVLIEIQNTLKPDIPENQVMKKASNIGVSTTTIFYMLCGTLGYAAFGNSAPGNFLTGFGFYDPFWLVDIGNIFIIVHLIGAYQVFCQPFFEFVEEYIEYRWPDSKITSSKLVIKVPCLAPYNLYFFRSAWRTTYVVMTAILAMMFPFFNEVIGFLGAVTFWPLTIYFPISMYMKRANINRTSTTGIWLMVLMITVLIIAFAATVASVQGIIEGVRHYRPFKLA